MTPAAAAAWSGHLLLRPGVPVPHNLQAARPDDLVARLGLGQPAQAWPGRVASLFNLCGHAQRLCATLAVQAASPGRLAPLSGVAEALRRETAQEHVRRIALDWPRLLGAGPTDGVAAQAVAAVRTCPLLSPDRAGADPWPALAGWLQQALLHMPASAWLRAWQDGGAHWLSDWSQAPGGWLPRLLCEARAWDGPEVIDPSAALRAPLDGADFGDAVVGVHTGSWTRQGAAPLPTPLTPWALLGSRIAELITLSQTGDGPAALAWGARATGPGEGMAWVEMARGLLQHRVVVDADTGRLSACQLRSPTDWNFHPEGAVAQQLAALDVSENPEHLTRRVRLLVAAFDPCVPFDVACPSQAQVEPHHA